MVVRYQSLNTMPISIVLSADIGNFLRKMVDTSRLAGQNQIKEAGAGCMLTSLTIQFILTDNTLPGERPSIKRENRNKQCNDVCLSKVVQTFPTYIPF